MRHCRPQCGILQYIPFRNGTAQLDREMCPIQTMKKTRKNSEWYFVKDGVKLYPMCEEKGSKSGKRGGLMVL